MTSANYNKQHFDSGNKDLTDVYQNKPSKIGQKELSCAQVKSM